MNHSVQVFFLLLAALLPGLPHAQTAKQFLDSARTAREQSPARVAEFGAKAYQVSPKGSIESAQAAFYIGMGSFVKGDHDNALKWYLQSLDNSRSLRDTALEVMVANELAILYIKQQMFSEAQQINAVALRQAAASGDIDRLGTAYNARGLYHLDLKHYDSAALDFRQAYFHYKRVNSTVGMSYCLDYLSSTVAAQGKLDDAQHYLESSMKLRVEAGDRFGVIIAINNIGELLLQKKQAAAALPYFRKARDSANVIGFTDLVANTWKMEAQAEEALGHTASALKATQEYQKLYEQMNNAQRESAREEMQARYNKEKTEQANRELTARNEVQRLQMKQTQLLVSRGRIAIIALSIGALLIAGISWLLYNRYKLKQAARLREELLREEQLRTAAVLEAEEGERQRLARELHDGVGQMLAATRRTLQRSEGATAGLDSSLDILDESIREVRQLSHSMMPPSLLNKTLIQSLEELASRTGQSTGITVHTDWTGADSLALDKTQTLMLYRAVQEIIANAIRHSGAENIHIELVNHDTELTLMVYDDGRGFDKETMLAGGGGLGLKNIQSRVAYIGGSLDLDAQPGAGTTYIIELPLQIIA